MSNFKNKRLIIKVFIIICALMFTAVFSMFFSLLSQTTGIDYYNKSITNEASK